MDLNKLHEALNNLAESVKRAIRESMIENGLKEDAHIVEDLTSEAVGLDLVKVLIHDYYMYINNGSHYTTYPPPIDAIIKWCEEHGMETTNGEAYAIRQAIFKRGITARPFVGDAILAIDDLYDSFGNEVFNIFCEEVDKLMGK